MKRTELRWTAARWLILFSVASVVVPLGMAQEQPPSPAVITVESKTVAPATKTTIAVTVDQVPDPGIASLQGQFTYDPKVLIITDPVKGIRFPQIIGGVTVFNAQEPGKVRFATTMAGANLTGIKSGVLVEFDVEAVGVNGDKSNLTLTVEVLSDVDFTSVPYQIVNGVFEIKEVENRPPVADFTFSPAQPTAGQTVQFTDKSKDPDGKIVSWSWDFGDGVGKSELQNPTYVYRTAGTFKVKLTVTDDKGAQASTEKTLTVQPGTPGVTITNFPNPAKDRTKFVYGWVLPAPSRQATLKIFNIKGELVFSKDLEITRTEFVYDLNDTAGQPLSNGPYFYVLSVTTQDNRSFRSSVGVLSVQR